jgi:putative NIF3 family GTP cyclohydrolase 1 type 2
MLCSKIIYYLNKIAPESSALEWDNVGLIIGNKNCEIKKIIIGLDLTDDLIKQAIDQKANLIITHPPIFFKIINKLASDS